MFLKLTREHQVKRIMPRINPISCPICYQPSIVDLSRHLLRAHGIDGQERKSWLRKARFQSKQKECLPLAKISPLQQPLPQPTYHHLSTISPQSHCEQQDLPMSTTISDDEELIPCSYDSRIRYDNVMGQNVPILDYDVLKIHHPFSMLVAGPRGAGKSEFVKRLLTYKDFIMTNAPERIVWFYGRYQPDLFQSLCKEVPNIEFYQGLPSNIESLFDRSKRNLCIIDDLMQTASSNQTVEDLFTNGRHLNLSVAFISQNLFYKGKNSRTISLNSTYIVVFKNPRDQSQIRQLACQMYPGKAKILQAAFEIETKEPHHYLFLDLHPESPEFARMRGNIFPHDLLNDPCWFYLPKDMQI